MAKGTLYNLIGRALFILSAYGIHVVLGRYFGPELYGTFGVILSLLAINYIFLANGVRQAVSKYTSEESTYASTILKKGLKVQLLLALSIALIYFLSAKEIAFFLQDINLTKYIRFSAVIIPFMGFYFTYLGSLNGRKEFGREALAMSTYSIIRVIAVLAFVLLLNLEINGAISGFFIATLIAMLLARFLCKHYGSNNIFEARKIINFAVPIIVFFVGVTLLMNLDLLFIKKLISNEKYTGFYTAAITFARTPYFLFYALSATLLPSISKSFAENDMALTKKYIRQSLRYLLLILLPLTAIISVTSTNLITLFYTRKYAVAGSPLSILIWGMSFLIATVILTTIINGIGRPKVSMLILLPMIPIDIVLNYILIPRYGLQGAATATTVTTFIGTAIAATYVYREFRILVNPISFAKVVLASGIIFLIAKNYSTSGMMLIPEYIGLFAIYGMLVFAFREINKEDVEVVKRLIRKNKQ